MANSSSPLPLSLAPPRGVPSFCGPGGGVAGGFGAAALPARSAGLPSGSSAAVLGTDACATRVGKQEIIARQPARRYMAAQLITHACLRFREAGCYSETDIAAGLRQEQRRQITSITAGPAWLSRATALVRSRTEPPLQPRPPGEVPVGVLADSRGRGASPAPWPALRRPPRSSGDTHPSISCSMALSRLFATPTAARLTACTTSRPCTGDESCASAPNPPTA